MKYFLLLLTIGTFSCQNSDVATNTDTPVVENNSAVSNKVDSTKIEWLDPAVQELGKAKEGQTIEISWRFKNTGEAPLIISDVRAGCGCTVAEKPEEPIAPGEQGVIRAKFDTKGQLYSQHKNVYVRANNTNKNAAGEDVLGFKVDVEKQ